MEKNIKHAVNLEFIGLPGCGKSVSSHMLAEKLKDMGYSIEEPTYQMDHKMRPSFRKVKKVCLFSGALFFNCRFCFCFLKLLIKYRILICNFKGLVSFFAKIRIYSKEKDKYVYIWDEGIWQSILSLKRISYECINEAYALVNRFYTFILVYIMVDVDTALQRMNMRKTNDSSVEKEKNETKKRVMLENYLRYLEYSPVNYTFESENINELIIKMCSEIVFI